MTDPVLQNGFLPVTDGHTIFYQIHGPADGLPLLFLHGGPGSGFNPDYLRFFAGKPIRLITFDQRGTGQSTPRGIDPYNTTPHLIADIEALRRFIGVDRWHVSGHSWGTTLALYYAQHYPSVCVGLMLISLFLGRRRDQEQSFKNTQMFFPDLAAAMSKDLPAHLSFDQAILDRLQSDDFAIQINAAYRFSMIGAALVSMTPAYPDRFDISESDINKARLLLHYAAQDFFMPDNIILDQAQLLRDMPIWLLHGRYDLDCLPQQAFELKTTLPHVDLRFVPGSHSLAEDAMTKGVYALIDDVVRLAGHV